MKEVIILQNSAAFTVDINQLYAPHTYRLHLIVNPASFSKLQERQQDKLFHRIYLTEDFGFESIVGIITTIIADKPAENISIVTNSEWCVALCGQLRQHFNIQGLDAKTALRFTNKIIMKKSLDPSCIRMPKHLLFDEEQYAADPEDYLNRIIKELGASIFAKPIDDANSNFTCRIDSSSQLFAWAQNKEKNKSFELDEYIEGRVYNVDAINKNGKILASYVCEYSCPPFEFLMGKPIGNITLPLEYPGVSEMLALNHKILTALSYQGSGATHLEIFKNQANELVFLEIAARAGGAWLPRIYKTRWGFNLFETNFLSQIDPAFTHKIQPGPYAAFLWYPYLEGTVAAIELPDLQSKFVLEYNVYQGDKTKKSASLREIAANILFWHEDFNKLYEDFSKLKNLSIIKMIS